MNKIIPSIGIIALFAGLYLCIVLFTSAFLSALSSDKHKKDLRERPVIIDHDGAIDDTIATVLHLLYKPEQVKAITIVPADCYAKPAVWVTKKLIDVLAPTYKNIPVGVSGAEGPNPFPHEWREDAWRQARMHLWADHKALDAFSLAEIPSAVQVLTQALQESEIPVDIIATGPCSNLADLLGVRPQLKEKINRIFIMGGAFDVPGNVDQPGHDGSAEWNIYNNPQAFYEVLRSGVSITLVPLDATQHTPIRQSFLTTLKDNLNHLVACRVVHDSLQIIKPFIENGSYLFWDTLTSAAAINSDIVHTKKMHINVALEGSSLGRTFEDKNGFLVDVALWADQNLFEKVVLEIIGIKK